MISFVAAIGKNHEMGLQGHLPWRGMKADLARYYALTRGKHIVMGGRTFQEYQDVHQTFPGSKIFVLSDSIPETPGTNIVHDIAQIIELAKQEDLWVIGGASIFTQLLPYADAMFLTLVHHEFEADTFFPDYSTEDWRVAHTQDFRADADNPYDYTFVELRRKLRQAQ